MIVLSDDFECRRRLGPTRLVARGVLWHPGGTAATQRDNQEVINVFHDLGELPVEAFEHSHIEPAPKNAVLEPSTIRFQDFGNATQSLGIANIVADAGQRR